MERSTSYEVINARTGEVLASRGKLADSLLSRARGLLGKKRLEADEALIIRPCWSVHTLFMRFKIDVIFLSKGGTVRKIVPSLSPWRFAASFGAYETIEMAGGSIESRDMKPGDRIELRPRAERATWPGM